MRTYIIHVSDAYDREKHILKEVENKNLNFAFINQGDKSDLSTAVLDTYFAGKMATVSAATSCAYKHILSYEKMLANHEDLALILEDDICFYANFSEINKILDEIKRRKLSNFIISLEDSILRYVPRSERKKENLSPQTRSARRSLSD